MSDDLRWDREAAPLFEQARAELKDEAVPPAALARAKAGLRERVAQGPRASLAPKLALAGAFALLAVAVVMWKRLEAAAEPRIVVAEGSVGPWGEGDDIAPSTVLATGQAAVSLALGDAVRAQLLPDSKARAVSTTELELLEGRVKVRAERGPFKIVASDVTLEVVGTVFEVAAHAGEVQVHVSEGAVRVARGAERWEVHAGDSWPPPAPPAPAEAQRPAAEHLTRLEQAQELTRSGRLDAARGIYQALAREDAPIAELALYHLAHLEAQRAKRPRLALEALDELLRRFPNGNLAHEAKLSRLEALRTLGVDAGH